MTLLTIFFPQNSKPQTLLPCLLAQM